MCLHRQFIKNTTEGQLKTLMTTPFDANIINPSQHMRASKVEFKFKLIYPDDIQIGYDLDIAICQYPDFIRSGYHLDINL